MFRSLSQDVENDGNASTKPTLSVVTSLPFGAGRRRTRAQAKLDIDERREQLKRTREAMEAMNKRAKTVPAKSSSASGMATPPRANKVVIGASFGGNLPVERTPTKTDARSPPSVRRVAVAPQVSVPSPGKMAATMKKEIVGVGENANNGNNATNNTAATTNNSMKTRRLPSRGIAQSSSSGTLTRKRMISFSPERAERPVNEEAERLKLQRNLKATEKLQLRLEGIPVRTPEKPTLPESMRTPQQHKPPSRTQTPSHEKPQHTPQQLRPSPSTASGSKHEPVVPSPPAAAIVETQATPGVRSDTPPSQASESQRTLELPSDDGEARVASRSRSPATANGTTVASCKKELDFTVADCDVVMTETVEETQTKAKDLLEDVAGGEEATGCLSQPSEPQSASVEHSKLLQEPVSTTTIGFEESSESFTSTSVIEDVGLFNCEHDVEFSGGVYGEGTDGKVSAAMVRGQKVAIKRAKPHEGFPEEEAKRRSAVELYYLRRVRNVQGFVQCLGLCDAIDHTCIALEVLDCKLSDYLRKYGKAKSSGSSSSKRRCFTLSVDATRSMLKQICQPMMVLHDQVNVAHGDLACRNILLRLPPTGYEKTWEPVVKLSDFGRIKTPATEPPIFDEGFSFYKNCDVGSFAREILYRLLVGEIVPTNCTETRNLHKHLQDVVVERIPESAKEKLGPFYRLFKRCAGWGVRPSFREIVDHLDDLEYFETSENGYFPLKPANGTSVSNSTMSLETASFLSPMMEGSRHKTPSSESKNNKYETPATANPRNVPVTTTATAPPSTNATSNGPRMLPGKSFTDGNGPGQLKKTVNWLKARSVHPGGQQITSKTTATSTPLGRPALPKKTPPSAGASRRSLQILNQIQHRQKEKKKC